MRRREFIASTLATAAFAGSARAQTTSLPTPKRIGIVDPASKAEEVTIKGITGYRAYFRELNRLGYIEGRTLMVERYLGLGQTERQAENVRAVVASHPDAILAIGGAVARQLKPLTTTIPIITITGDPVAGKIVTNLARPDANITGVSVDAGPEFYGKRLDSFSRRPEN